MATCGTPPSLTCAACGKEGGDSLKACTACKLVKYCNRDCQIAHRSKHKKSCRKRAAELHDEALFKEHPPDECPICLLLLPSDDQTMFKSCCGKVICEGCIYTMISHEGRELCPFCRKLRVGPEDDIKDTKKLIEAGNAEAFNALGGFHFTGQKGMQQDAAKANQLWMRGGELGCSMSYNNLGNSYLTGMGVDLDKKKAKHYYELAAMGGNVAARYNLGVSEAKLAQYAPGYNPSYRQEYTSYRRAFKHFVIAARAGHRDSLDKVKDGYMSRLVTKEEYEGALRAYQRRQDETKSDARDRIAANVRRIGRSSS